MLVRVHNSQAAVIIINLTNTLTYFTYYSTISSSKVSCDVYHAYFYFRDQACFMLRIAFATFTMYIHTYYIILCNVIILIFLQTTTCVSCGPGEKSEPRQGQCCPACVPSTYICLCVERASEALIYQQLTVVRHFGCNLCIDHSKDLVTDKDWARLSC